MEVVLYTKFMVPFYDSLILIVNPNIIESTQILRI